MEMSLANDATEHSGSATLRFTMRASESMHVDVHVFLGESLEERAFLHRHIHR
jgi:hypothetical protein